MSLLSTAYLQQIKKLKYISFFWDTLYIAHSYISV